MDSRLEGQYSSSAARKIAKLADNCLLKNAKDRPTMSQVVERLKQIILQSDEDNTSEISLQSLENDPVETEKKTNQAGPSESCGEGGWPIWQIWVRMWRVQVKEDL